jgi:hypothetical protein
MPKRRERDLWILTAKNIPRLLSEVKIEHARYFCREGDRKWKPIEDLAKERRGTDSLPNTQAPETTNVTTDAPA